jgi:hypothetical protein
LQFFSDRLAREHYSSSQQNNTSPASLEASGSLPTGYSDDLTSNGFASTDPPTTIDGVSIDPTSDVACTTWLAPSQTCYPLDHDSIVVSFNMCNPYSEDYVGIYNYHDGLDQENLENPVMWIWSCGRSDLSDCVSGMAIASTADILIGGTLGEGMY